MKYKGKFEKNNSAAPARRGFKRLAPQAIVLLLVVAVLSISAVAWLVAHTDTVTNQFTIAQVSCKVDETFATGGTEKTNVSIRNTSDIYAYIRVALVATWEDDEGNIMPLGASLNDLQIIPALSSADGWFKGNDGYYYCKSSIAPDALTPVLISSAKVDENSEGYQAGYTMNLQILCEAIQATPDSAVYEAWGVTVSNGVLSTKLGGGEYEN